MPEYSDKELIKKFKSGNKNHAFDLIVRKYQKKLYWHIKKMVICHNDTDDILQNTFIKVWNSLNNFREESNLYTWLYKIATNESITFLNKKKKESDNIIKPDNDYLINSLKSDVYFSGNEIQKKLQEAIISLPQKQRIVFNMKYFDNIKYEDMAKILETSTGALKASYHHAVKKIKIFFEEN